jgi:Fe2+ transport system protein FeoA
MSQTMALTTSNPPQATIHLPTVPAAAPPTAPRQPSNRKGLHLTDLQPGESARVTRVALTDTGCRKRFAELGLAEGMKVTVTATGDTLLLILGSGRGTRMGVAARCAEEVFVSRIKS